jgi:hypothetical protein
MVVVLEESPVPRSIFLTSTCFGGTRILGRLARISNSSRLTSSAMVTTSFLSLAACALAVI